MRIGYGDVSNDIHSPMLCNREINLLDLNLETYPQGSLWKLRMHF